MRKLFAAILCSCVVSLSFGQDMVKVEGGTFMMGSTNPLDQGASPVHSVTVGSFYIEKFEVTFEKWTLVRNWGLSHGYTDIWVGESGGNPVGSNNPVTHERWWDIIKWCNARSEMEGYDPVFYKDSARTIILRTGMTKPYGLSPIKWSANGYRLPTEAEWEFAARGGKQTHGYLYSGSNTPEAVGCWADTTVLPNLCQTHSVGQKAANELGLYDMSGNVWEACCDYYGPYSGEAQTDPTGPPTGQNCVIRGGSAQNYPFGGSLAYRMLNSLADGSGSYHGFRCARAPKITILKPRFREVVPSNSTYYIKWKAPGVDLIKIEYSLDNGKTYTVITPNVSAAADSFAWKVPDTLSSKCMMIMREINNPSDTTVNTNFRIKGYVLTRFKANGDYEKFDPALHAWQFKNDDTMWPQSWYSQFNYSLIDPYTKKQYPAVFRNAPIKAKAINFIDWPLFAKTFLPNRCYKNISGGVYSPVALKTWSQFKDNKFEGSCYGFSQSCLLAFDRPTQFMHVFPEIGTFQNIHDLQLNDAIRQIINQLYEAQYGRQHILHDEQEFPLSNVRQLLAKMKSYFLSDSIDHCALGIVSDSGGHSVVPYALEKYPNHNGSYIIWVYDNNNPPALNGNGKITGVVIDSIQNAWAYSPQNWTRHDGFGLLLNDPASTYLSTPILWTPKQTKSASGDIISGKCSTDSTYMSIYNSASSAISITNAAGQSIGFNAGKSYNTLGEGIPIVPKNSKNQPPIGYFVPDDKYSIQMSALTDSLTIFSVLNQKAMFNYWRSDAVKNQTDNLVYDGGLGFRNPDAQTKTINLEVINRLADCESDFQILNFDVVQNDSVRLESSDFNRVALINQGPAKTYDLNIVKACESSSGQFEHDRIPIPAHSTHFIAFDLQDLSNDSVKIYEDKGNTGIISDSLFVANVTTGIENPTDNNITGKFSLIQNYPNPFNSITTIKYRVTKPGFVSLKVFDVLGIEVASLVNEKKPIGEYSIEWNASGLAGGIYFCKLQNENSREVRKMLLMK